ncbi:MULTISPECIES: transporter substrate-binding domain-containing protein [Acinetobacter]|uniref:Transporter substrate-binding domain-containing protein n=2 Tax=Acinetobacter TaxID=469 RepID=A0A4Q7AWD0_9GAMM|nr:MULTISPECIES: transporter substrate-binding domain-containing protein [Acinetobacter]MCW8038879.1 transporter substrate-binding domain-containing protein [Acinetobacter entericus]RZG66152.1 transporter substrate-binding domain-containing protein [Acinetobacter bouvetii]
MIYKRTMTSLFCASALMLGLSACSDNKAPSSDKPAGGEATASDSGTLDKIKKSGTIVLGYRDSSIPFSYIADNPNQPVGYAHDLQLKVVEAVKKKLNMPDLKVRYNLVTSQNRIPLVSNGTVDLECGSTTNNKERQQQVAFSTGFFEVGSRLLTAKDSGVKDFADLKGKKLVTTAGTTSERYIRQHEKELGIGEVISAKDHAESFLMLQNGRAAAFMMDDILLAGEKSKAKDPNKWEIVGTAPIHEIYGCMMRKGDTGFKQVVDDAIKATYSSGEINEMYKKWFQTPIPPKNINLNFPMSDQLKTLISNPHDRDE